MTKRYIFCLILAVVHSLVEDPEVDEEYNRGFFKGIDDEKVLNTAGLKEAPEFLDISAAPPAEFNWFSGRNLNCMIDPASDQSMYCGSCFSFATMTMLDLRLW